jgi:hypothetical protein
MIRQQNRLLDALAGQLNAGSEIANSAEVRARLRDMADVYQMMRSAMTDALRRWKHGKRFLHD